MIVWTDVHISPTIAPWLQENFGVQAHAMRDLGYREAEDKDIFLAARDADAVIMSKDSDFPTLLEQLGPPPRIIWITCGNTSNTRLKEILTTTFDQVIKLLMQGESLVEIRDLQ